MQRSSNPNLQLTQTESKCGQGVRVMIFLAKTREKNQQVKNFFRSFWPPKTMQERRTEHYGALQTDFSTARNFWCLESHFIYDFSAPPKIKGFLWKEPMTKLKRLMVKCKQILGKTLFVRRVVVTGSVKTPIEESLVKSSATYPYIENLNKSFIIHACQNCFVKEKVFGTEPIRMLILCMVKNSLCRSTVLN